MFWWWEETGAPGRKPTQRQGEPVNPTQKGPAPARFHPQDFLDVRQKDLDSNPGLSCCEATVLITIPPCSPTTLRYIFYADKTANIKTKVILKLLTSSTFPVVLSFQQKWIRESSDCWIYTVPLRLSGVTTFPFKDILPARNSTRYLLELPLEPLTKLGKRAPDDIFGSLL